MTQENEILPPDSEESAEVVETPLPKKKKHFLPFHFSWKRFFCVMGFLIGFLLIAYTMLFFYLDYNNALPIKQVKVIGTYQYVNEQAIQKTVNPFLAGKGLFSFSEFQAENALKSLPGVESASLWRIYPGTVRIILREKSAAARLPSGALLASDGSTFVINNLAGAQNLPLLNGNVQYAKQMLEFSNSITPVFAEENLTVTGLSLAENGGWSVQINHQFWITLGKDHLQDRVVDFLTDYPVLIANTPAGQQLSTVDLRYTHGFTASWQKTVVSASNS
ncbi:MAG: FtsQ-type POTRA domain-containing protein [Gammaproteobacteria bacterium]|nr:FtsQ-type POTRA domain-containing protein [Gammaproteobacteria bacterium]